MRRRLAALTALTLAILTIRGLAGLWPAVASTPLGVAADPTPPGTHSFADLESLTLRIAQDEPALEGEGIYLAQWGPDVQTDTVEIVLSEYDSTAAQDLLARYGSAWVSVSPTAASRPIPANRYSDYAPFYGGDWIYYSASDSTHYCTGGPNVVSNVTGQTYSLIAGHCAPTGTTLYTNTGNQQTFGTVSTRYYCSGCIDAELVASSTAGYVWGNSGAVFAQRGTSNPGVGSSVCFDGAKTGENCGDIVAQYDICVALEGGPVVCHVAEAYNNNHAVCQLGDSGGPVYTKSGSSVYIARTIEALTSVNDCFYTIIGYELSVFNVHIQIP